MTTETGKSKTRGLQCCYHSGFIDIYCRFHGLWNEIKTLSLSLRRSREWRSREPINATKTGTETHDDTEPIQFVHFSIPNCTIKVSQNVIEQSVRSDLSAITINNQSDSLNSPLCFIIVNILDCHECESACWEYKTC